MLDYDSTLPKHLVVISPITREGTEVATRVDVEYEWLPQRCKLCCSLGHTLTNCPDNKKKVYVPPVTMFVKKASPVVKPAEMEADMVAEVEGSQSAPCNEDIPLFPTAREETVNKTVDSDNRGKGIMLYNPFDALTEGTWTAIKNLAENITDEPWLILGDFNAVIDTSEVCGRAADTTASMTEFRNCILETGLIHLPFTGSPFTWHNCSEGPRSLWKRLDRMLVNAEWLNKWPESYISALPSTSDHSPLILNSANRGNDHGMFRFDNYLTKRSGFLDSVRQVWRHRIAGTDLYGVVIKLKALKSTFRQQRKETGNLTENVQAAKRFLDRAQELFETYKDDLLLHLVKCCRLVYSVAIKMEANMLKQRAKITMAETRRPKH
ncbi:UNVERIFIED_CONTAM: hypothetical protein Sangu_2637700 [Sesamum angustifolium]|uniref:Endonuclease/exonuclease/phosphatase domain-containing protein n=1 Tax=Sesamum angustifolium TaxID=2727405 RepID=A0AAW2J3E9_9LAMI